MVSLVKRYTPPTCSLEIVGKMSSLSIYMQKPILKELYFQLNFDDPRLPTEKQITIRGDRTSLDFLCNTVQQYVQQFLSQTTNYSKVSQLPSSSSAPYLRSQGLLNHKFYFGNLSQEASQQSILLSAVQLFDLANALDEYKQEMLHLPELYSSKSRKLIPIFTSAAVVVAAVGLTVGIKLFQQSSTTSESVANNPIPEIIPTTPKKEQSDVIPPKPSDNQPIAPANVPKPLTTRQKLSPPSVVNPPQPPKLEENRVNPAQPPTLNEKPSELVIIPQPQPKPQESETPTIVITPQTTETKPSPILENPTEVPTLPDNPQIIENPTETPNMQNNSDLGFNLSKSPISESNLDDNLFSNSRNDITYPIEEENTSATDSLINSNETKTAFNNDPQITEVKDYFQKTWQPIEGLKETLEYRLIINKKGHLQTLIPLGYASEAYLPQVDFPSSNQAFVSPLSENQKQTIRLVLEPNGNVSTFLESGL